VVEEAERRGYCGLDNLCVRTPSRTLVSQSRIEKIGSKHHHRERKCNKDFQLSVSSCLDISGLILFVLS
jgi:hypothetical protein